MASSFGKTPHELVSNAKISRRYVPYPLHSTNYQFKPKLEVDQFLTSMTSEVPETAQTLNQHLDQRPPPRFLSNLWIMLNDRNIKCINWTGENSFMVNNRENLMREVLPHFFKHNRLSSFTRQLHLYQFSKVKQKAALEWSHIYLKRGDYESLFKIRRKLSTDDKKLQNFIEKLVIHLQAQQQKIVDLKFRIGLLEDDVKMSQDVQLAMQQELLAVQEMMGTLSHRL